MLSLLLMKRGMAFPAGLMMVLRITVLVLIQLLPPASSLKDTHDNYCAPSSCGNIPNISYPFRLKGDPPNCGDKRYELSCDDNNHTLLSLHDSSKYYVSQINYNNYTIRIVDAGIQEDNYSFIPRSFINHRGLNNWDLYSTYVRTNWSRRGWIDVSEVVVIANCEKLVAQGSSFHFVSTSMNCSNTNNGSGSASNSSLSQYSKRYIYLNISRMGDWVTVMDVEESCPIEQMSLTSWPGQINEDPNISCTDLRNFFSYGFELSWFYSTLCGSCGSYHDCYLGDDNQAHCDPYLRSTFATYFLAGLSIVALPASYIVFWTTGTGPITENWTFSVVIEEIIGLLLDPSMRYSTPQSPVLSTATIGAMLQQENNSLANKSDFDAIYDLVSLGTRYSSSIVVFSQQVQAKNHEVEKLKEQIVVLQ